jgi:predicted aspartyl protease
MRRVFRLTAISSILLANAIRGVLAQTPAANISSADALFQAGKFADAEKIYSSVVQADPKSYPACLKLANIALLGNRLTSAVAWSHRALALKGGDADAKIILAEALYREGRFAQAGAAIGTAAVETEAVKQSYSSLNVAKLESFAGQTPYEFHGSGQSIRIKFVKSEPLPVIQVIVNGGKPALFFIDTGGSELLLDSEFAKELGVKTMGSVTGIFAGDQKAPVGNGRVDSMTLGDWTLKNVPVGMIPLRSMSAMFGVPQLDGCVGTSVLYQFLSTIDYPAGELVLRRKTTANLKAFDAEATNPARKRVAMPMWMAGDHFMVTWGQVQTLAPSLFFVDSGLTGGGVNLAEPVIKAAGISLEKDKASAGQGGGGHLITIPYTVTSFSLGEITQKKVTGTYNGPFPFTTAWGFHVDGMVGHDFLKPYAVTLDFARMRLILQ